MTYYIKSTSCTNKKEIWKQFCEQNSHDPVFTKVIDIINKYDSSRKNGVDYKIFKAQNKYLIMLTCHNDNTLISLANEYNFPRGFTIVYDPEGTSVVSGFYPKFKNDTSEEDCQPFNDSYNEVSICEKVSGHLIGLIPLNTNEWTIVSKNSADHSSLYIQNAKRIILSTIPKIKELVSYLYKNKLTVYFEMLSFEDQTHGYRVLKEIGVCTAISKGYFTGNSEQNTFTKFVKIKSICDAFGLTYGTIHTFTGPDIIKLIFQKLLESRDFMTSSKYKNIIHELGVQYPESITTVQGNFNHLECCGENIEGLILKGTSPSESRIIKYKFPYYTFVTFVLREVIKKHGMYFINNGSSTIKWFVAKWCFNEEGKEYFTKLFKIASLFGRTRVYEHQKIGNYILLAEDLYSLNEQQIQESIANYNESYNDIEKINMIICCGPIGSGKSSEALKICQINPDLFEHIDGDLLGTDLKIVLKMGIERNPYTMYKIYDTILRNKIPVLSTGGGVLTDKNELVIRNNIISVFKKDLNMIVFVPALDGNYTKYDKDNKLHNITSVYEKMTKDDMESILKHRVENNIYTIPEEYTIKGNDKAISNWAHKMLSISKNNLKFAEMLSIDADHVYTWNIHEKDYKRVEIPQETFNFLNELQQIKIDKLCSLYQSRLLCSYRDCVGHVTLKYCSKTDGSYELTSEDIPSVPEKVIGKLYKMNNDNIEISFIEIAQLNYIKNYAHITVNPGCHAPVEMGKF